MKDLTRGSITLHILVMAAPVAMSLLSSTAYHLIDLYFISRTSVAATAGMTAAGNASFIMSFFTQMLSAGAAIVIAHSVGRKDLADVHLVFNQAIALSLSCAALMLAALYLLARPYMHAVSTDEATVDAGVAFIMCVAPGYALLLPMVTLSATLRGAGIIQPTMVIYIITMLLNAALAPVFIAGWGVVPGLGVRGAGLATTLAVIVGTALMIAYFRRTQPHMSLTRALLYPRIEQWRRILSVGLPAGAEFALMFLSTSVVYYAIRDSGAAAQAGFGVGSRIVQAILLPGMSVAFVAGPIAGQNFGARNIHRVRQVFWTSAMIGTAVMVLTTVLAQWQRSSLVNLFGSDPDAAAAAEAFLRLVSWSFVAQGLIYTCTYMFQGLGNTMPSLVTAAIRLLLFAVTAVWLSEQPGFSVDRMWCLLTASVAGQAALSLWLLRLEFRRKLQPHHVSV